MSSVVASDDQGILVLSVQKSFMLDHRLDEFHGAYQPKLEAEKRLVVDLGELDYIDSKHLAALVVCYKRTLEVAGRIVFCGLKPAVRETFLVTRLDRIFTITATRNEALQQLAAPAAGSRG